MRICIIAYRFPPTIGGLQSYAYHSARILAEWGHTVCVVAETLEEGDGWPADLPRPFELRRLPSLKSFVHGQGSLFACLAELRETLADFRPDLIHVHDPLSLLAVNLTWSDARTPLFFSFHWVFDEHGAGRARRDYGAGRLNQAATLGLERSLMQFIFSQCRYERLIAVGPPFVHWADVFGAPPHKVVYLPNGVDPELFSPQPPDPKLCADFGVEAGDSIVLCPVRIVPRKGVTDVIRALGAIEDRHVKLLVVGSTRQHDAAYAQEVRDLIRRLGLEQRVRLIEGVSLGRMPRTYAVSDLVVLPSYMEGLSIALLEAMACGRPVITTDAPGNRELIAHDQNGLLVPPGDVDAIGRAIAGLLDDPERGRRLGEAGRRAVVEEYDLRDKLRQTVELYEQALADGADPLT
jgi:glycosyltransferase involved in cell wall biosynthesis